MNGSTAFGPVPLLLPFLPEVRAEEIIEVGPALVARVVANTPPLVLRLVPGGVPGWE